jgi:hypothetical protein
MMEKDRFPLPVFTGTSFMRMTEGSVGMTVMVILSGGMVLGSPAAGDEGAEIGETTLCRGIK